ncbi:MAG: phosphotransferase [Pseudonocardia sp.]
MFPPGLSMLWESTDPRRALQARFGFDGYDHAVAWLTTALVRAWAIDVLACERILISAGNAIAWLRTDRGTLVAKWSGARHRFDRLVAVADLLPVVHERGVPVAPPLPSIDARHRVILDSGASPLSMSVHPHVVGDLLDIVDETAVRRAGACLASLHRALAVHRDGRLTEVGSVDLRHRVEEWLGGGDTGVAPAASARLRDQVASLPSVDRAPQLIHADYRASNILTVGSEVRAVLDFDGVTWDHCVTDLANAFVRLGTHFTDWRPTPARVRDTLLEGYQSVRPLSRLEHEWLRAITLWYGIMAVPAGDDPVGWADAL